MSTLDVMYVIECTRPSHSSDARLTLNTLLLNILQDSFEWVGYSVLGA